MVWSRKFAAAAGHANAVTVLLLEGLSTEVYSCLGGHNSMPHTKIMDPIYACN